jgi:hypothetical protein
MASNTASGRVPLPTLRPDPEPAADEHSEVDYSKYISEAARLETFVHDWPHDKPDGSILAAAGFCFVDGSAPDEVCCPCCDALISGFDKQNIWTSLAHESHCELKPKVGEAKNRSCTECCEIFRTIGAKLNHYKRVHPLGDEERRKKALLKQQRKETRDGRLHGIVKIRARGAGGRLSNGSPAQDEQKRTERYRTGAIIDTGSEVCRGGVREGIGPLGSLSYSGVMLVQDCEPTVWSGEIVLSRAEYREFRQHIRNITRVFKRIDPVRRT